MPLCALNPLLHAFQLDPSSPRTWTVRESTEGDKDGETKTEAAAAGEHSSRGEAHRERNRSVRPSVCQARFPGVACEEAALQTETPPM